MYTPFARKALIMPFQRFHVVQHFPKRSYKDDVARPCFMIAARTYADKQRNGLQEERLDSLYVPEHVAQALSSPFFFLWKRQSLAPLRKLWLSRQSPHQSRRNSSGVNSSDVLTNSLLKLARPIRNGVP